MSSTSLHVKTVKSNITGTKSKGLAQWLPRSWVAQQPKASQSAVTSKPPSTEDGRYPSSILVYEKPVDFAGEVNPRPSESHLRPTPSASCQVCWSPASSKASSGRNGRRELCHVYWTCKKKARLSPAQPAAGDLAMGQNFVQ